MKTLHSLFAKTKTYLVIGALLLVGAQVLGATTQIQTNLSNALMVIQRILVTSDGTLSGPKVMDIGSGAKVTVYSDLDVSGTGSFSGGLKISRLCDAAGTSCKTFSELTAPINLAPYALISSVYTTGQSDGKYATTAALSALSGQLNALSGRVAALPLGGGTSFLGFNLSPTGILSTGTYPTVDLDARYAKTGSVYTIGQSDARYTKTGDLENLSGDVYKKYDGSFSFIINQPLNHSSAKFIVSNDNDYLLSVSTNSPLDVNGNAIINGNITAHQLQSSSLQLNQSSFSSSCTNRGEMRFISDGFYACDGTKRQRLDKGCGIAHRGLAGINLNSTSQDLCSRGTGTNFEPGVTGYQWQCGMYLCQTSDYQYCTGGDLC